MTSIITKKCYRIDMLLLLLAVHLKLSNTLISTYHVMFLTHYEALHFEISISHSEKTNWG